LDWTGDPLTERMQDLALFHPTPLVPEKSLCSVPLLDWTGDKLTELREARKQVTFAIFAEEDDLNKVTATVDALFTLLQKANRA
jgi:hypothetical protein